MQPPQGLLPNGWTHPGSCNAAKPLLVGNENRNPRMQLQKTNTEGSARSRFNLVKKRQLQLHLLLPGSTGVALLPKRYCG